MLVNVKGLLNKVEPDKERAAVMYEECVAIGPSGLHITTFKEFWEQEKKLDKEEYFECPKYLIYKQCYNYWEITEPIDYRDIVYPERVEEIKTLPGIQRFVILKNGELINQYSKQE